MCRLFAMSGGTRAVQATFWLLDAPTSLLLQSETQPDGVGLGTFEPDGSPLVYRKPVSANRSQTFIADAREVRSTTFLAHIRHATAAQPTLETRKRVEDLLNKLTGGTLSAEQLRCVRAVEVLERIGTPEARQVLRTLAQGAPGALMTRQAQDALDRLEKRS